MFRGYGDDETFSIDYSFIKKYTKILKQFKSYGNSYPCRFKSYDDWEIVIDEMICYFELADENNPIYKCAEYNFCEYDYFAKLSYYYRRKALNMFVTYFDDLWD